jgi:rhodanese-related sulfurtransferase
MRVINRDQLRSMIERHDDFALVEVLPPQSFGAYHLPGAINIPLGNSFRERVAEVLPDKTQTIVVYCRDIACPASPKAAKELDKMGYQSVLEYTGGKADWRAAIFSERYAMGAKAL